MRVLLSAFALAASMVACGGSGSSDGFEVRVVIDGNEAAARSVRAGQEATLDVPSGSRVALSASASADLAIDRGGAALTTERTDEREQVFRLASPSGTQAVARLTASADAGEVVTLRLRVAPQRFDNRLRRAGESITYAVTRVESDGTRSVQPDRVHLVDSVAADGSHVVYYRRDARGGYEYDSFDRDGNRTLYAWRIVNPDGNNDSEQVSFWPAELLREFPLYVGKSWTTTWEDEVEGPKTSRNEVVAYETITLPAGTFATLHTRSTYRGGQRDCWWSVEQQIDVRCAVAQNGLATDGSVVLLFTTVSEAKTIVR